MGPSAKMTMEQKKLVSKKLTIKLEAGSQRSRFGYTTTNILGLINPV